MKFRLCLIFFVFISISVITFAGDIKLNPETPSGLTGKVSGRSLKVKEVLRITDGNDFIFRNIKRIRIDSKGFIYVAGKNQLLKFTSEGKFERNFIKNGEGPGEVKYFSNFFIENNKIIIGGVMPVEVLEFTKEGKLIREFTQSNLKPFTSLLDGWNKEKFYAYGAIDPWKIKSGVHNVKKDFYLIDKNGNKKDLQLFFMTKDIIFKKSNKKMAMIRMADLSPLITEFDGYGKMYVLHTERYLIEQVDLKSKMVVKKIKRTYYPVDYILRKYDTELDEEIYSVFKREKFNDIYNIATAKENLLVFTSTMNKKGEVLVDVFNSFGKYIDNFYLSIPGVKRPDDLLRKPLLFHDNYFWTIDIDEEEAPYVIKFELSEL